MYEIYPEPLNGLAPNSYRRSVWFLAQTSLKVKVKWQYLCAIDLSKAYDKVNHFGLFIKLMKRNIPELILQLIENLISDCYACVKWNDCWSVEFVVNFGVRQRYLLSPFLFAIYLDNRYSLCNPRSELFIIAYADDILLITQSVVQNCSGYFICEINSNSTG